MWSTLMTVFLCQSLVVADIRFPQWPRDRKSSRPTVSYPSRSHFSQDRTRLPLSGRLPRWSSEIISMVKPILSIIETIENKDHADNEAKKVIANAIEESTRRVHPSPEKTEDSTQRIRPSPDSTTHVVHPSPDSTTHVVHPSPDSTTHVVRPSPDSTTHVVRPSPDSAEETTRVVRPHPDANKSLDAIFFSNEIHDTSKNTTERRSVLPYNRTADCVNNNICNPTSNYPTNKIFKALKESSKTTKKLIKSLTKPSSYPEISLRLGGQGRDADNDITMTMEDNVCQTEKRRITPRGALNTEGEFMWILNEQKGEHQNYVQVVETTLCRESGSECLSGQIYGHRTRCKQEYTEHKLLALDREGEELIIDTFRFPSCCTCHVEKTFEL